MWSLHSRGWRKWWKSLIIKASVLLGMHLQAPVPTQHFAQIQWGMGLLQLPRCFFVVWAPACSPALSVVSARESVRLVATPKGLIQVTEIVFDEQFFGTMLADAARFWSAHYVPAAVLKEAGCLLEGEVDLQEQVLHDMASRAGHGEQGLPLCGRPGPGEQHPHDLS